MSEFRKVQEPALSTLEAEVRNNKTFISSAVSNMNSDIKKFTFDSSDPSEDPLVPATKHGELIEVKFIGNQTIMVFRIREDLRPQIAIVALQIGALLKGKFEGDVLSVKPASPMHYDGQLALVVSLEDVPSTAITGLHEVLTQALQNF